MAFSESIERAQTSAVCQFCEESPEIKWKCINCNLFLCQFCNSRIHSKSEASREHQVINLQECGTEDASETMRKVDLQRLQCSNHHEQKCFVYCTDCEQPICALCLVQVHQNHKLNQLDDIYEIKVNKIKLEKSNLESNLSFFNKEEDELKQLLTNGDKMYVETKNKILDREKEIKEAATKHAQELIQELDSQWKPSEEEIKKELSEVTKNKDELLDAYHILIQALQSHQASDIFSVSSQTLGKTFTEKSAALIKLKQTKFIPAKTSKQLSQTFGELYEVQELELQQSYQTELLSVGKILYCEHNTLFISSSRSQTLQKIQFENDKFKVEKEIKVEVYDFTMMCNGDILISSRENDLKLYSKDDIKTFKTFFPLFTLGVHVNEYNEIIVGLSDSQKFNIPTTDSVMKVIVLNQYGDLQHSYEIDRDNQRLFTLPCRICTYNDNICVVDFLNVKREGRVVVLNMGGQLQWVYNGCDSVNSGNNRFTPRDMTILNTSNIVISDSHNHAIHVLNQKGEIIICSVVKDLGVELPISLCIDTNKNLWIGCKHIGYGKAKIHCLKLTQ